MKFWDTSALVPLLIRENRTATATDELRSDGDILVWWGTEIECVAALARREREVGAVPAIQEGFRRLSSMARGWHVIEPTMAVKEASKRMLRVHPLRSQDAAQLAAAVVAHSQLGMPFPFLTFDEKLSLAAQREGFAGFI